MVDRPENLKVILIVSPPCTRVRVLCACKNNSIAPSIIAVVLSNAIISEQKLILSQMKKKFPLLHTRRQFSERWSVAG